MLANGAISIWLHDIWRQDFSTCQKIIFINLFWFFNMSPKYQIKSLFSHNHVCPNCQTYKKKCWAKTFAFMLANGAISIWLQDIWHQDVSNCLKVIYIYKVIMVFFDISPKYRIKSLFSHNHVCPNYQTYKI